MTAILDFRSFDIWEHFYVHRWIDHTPKHGIRHQDRLSRLNNTKVMRVFNFGYFGWRPYWIWPKKVPSRFFPPGILIDLVNRPPKDNNYVGFKTIPIFSRSNSIFMRLPVCWTHSTMMKPNDCIIDASLYKGMQSSLCLLMPWHQSRSSAGTLVTKRTACLDRVVNSLDDLPEAGMAGTNNYIAQNLWDVITCPCPRYLYCIFSKCLVNKPWPASGIAVGIPGSYYLW